MNNKKRLCYDKMKKTWFKETKLASMSRGGEYLNWRLIQQIAWI